MYMYINHIQLQLIDTTYKITIDNVQIMCKNRHIQVKINFW